jgi:hypothetical protein
LRIRTTVVPEPGSAPQRGRASRNEFAAVTAVLGAVLRFEWTPVPKDTIQNVTAPDAGAHVCAPKQRGIHKGMLYCVVLPPET